jgi:formylglycine-generating enzyme required for sulfatase activity
MSFEVIPPVAVQKAALAEGKRLSFLMGSRGWEHDEEPRHRVVIPRPFYLGTFPVTQEEFACFRPEHRNHFHGKPRHPVENVCWDDAQAFLRWLNGNRKLPGGLKARLPCEAEWEYACRAGTDTEYYNGDGEGALSEAGWYEGNAMKSTHPVGEKIGNPWGLHDMHGNVWEWCKDFYDKNAYRKREHGWLARNWRKSDLGFESSLNRAIRGGAWVFDIKRCRAPDRVGRSPYVRVNFGGFRILVQCNKDSGDR